MPTWRRQWRVRLTEALQEMAQTLLSLLEAKRKHHRQVLEQRAYSKPGRVFQLCVQTQTSDPDHVAMRIRQATGSVMQAHLLQRGAPGRPGSQEPQMDQKPCLA
jgi:hypothetical protein